MSCRQRLQVINLSFLLLLHAIIAFPSLLCALVLQDGIARQPISHGHMGVLALTSAVSVESGSCQHEQSPAASGDQFVLFTPFT